MSITVQQIVKLAEWADTWAAFVGDVAQRTPVAPFPSAKLCAAGLQDALHQTLEVIVEAMCELAAMCGAA